MNQKSLDKGKGIKNPVFAVVRLSSWYKYQTDIVENEKISNLIVETAHRHAEDNFTSTVYDANFVDWEEIHISQETDPEVIPKQFINHPTHH